jgi:predicted RNA-binding protein with PIN domain
MLIVDGCNVLSPIRPWHKPSSTGYRRLVEDVALLTRDWECCADVVFDGHPRATLRQGEVVSSVRVWFSEWQRADTCVVAHSHGHPPGALFVATSDRVLAPRARRLGAHVVSGEALRRALDIVCSAAHAGVARRSVLSLQPRALLALDGSLR